MEFLLNSYACRFFIAILVVLVLFLVICYIILRRKYKKADHNFAFLKHTNNAFPNAYRIIESDPEDFGDALDGNLKILMQAYDSERTV